MTVVLLVIAGAYVLVKCGLVWNLFGIARQHADAEPAASSDPSDAG